MTCSKGTLNDAQLQSRAKQAQALVDRVNLYSSHPQRGAGGAEERGATGQRRGGGSGHAGLRRCGNRTVRVDG